MDERDHTEFVDRLPKRPKPRLAQIDAFDVGGQVRDLQTELLHGPLHLLKGKMRVFQRHRERADETVRKASHPIGDHVIAAPVEFKPGRGIGPGRVLDHRRRRDHRDIDAHRIKALDVCLGIHHLLDTIARAASRACAAVRQSPRSLSSPCARLTPSGHAARECGRENRRQAAFSAFFVLRKPAYHSPHVCCTRLICEAACSSSHTIGSNGFRKPTGLSQV